MGLTRTSYTLPDVLLDDVLDYARLEDMPGADARAADAVLAAAVDYIEQQTGTRAS